MKLGLVGCGGYGVCLAEAVKGIPEMEIVSAWDPVRERAERISGRVPGSFHELIEDKDLDCVIVASPNEYHFQQVMESAGKGKHVFVEKPISTSWDKAVEMASACLEAGVTLVVGHNLEWMTPLVELKKRLPEVERASFSMSRKLGSRKEEGEWRFDKVSSPYGCATQLGIHGIGLFLLWFGPAMEPRGYVGERAGNGLPLEARIEWKTKEGIQAVVEADYLGKGSFLNVRIETASGDFVVEPGRSMGPGFDVTWDFEGELKKSRTNLLTRFARAVMEGEPGNGFHGAAALGVLKDALGDEIAQA